MLVDILTDGIFAAVAAIGFGAISDPPLRAFPSIALLAAIGHALRFCLMTYLGVDIATASLCASFSIGMGSLVLGKRIYCPMTVLYIPALLPMIPGMYAYRTFQAMFLCMTNTLDEQAFNHYAYLLEFNGLVTVCVVGGMVIGQILPMLAMKRFSFSATK